MNAPNRAPISNAVLMREAARTSRRWQVYGARMGFSGALMALLLLGICGDGFARGERHRIVEIGSRTLCRVYDFADPVSRRHGPDDGLSGHH